MTGAILDVLNGGVVAAGEVNQLAGEGEVVDLDLAVEVVDFAVFAVEEGGEDAGDVIFDVDPIATLEAIAVDGNRLSIEQVGDKKGDHFFRPVPGAVVVGAAGDDGRKMEAADKSLHEQFAAGFAGRSEEHTSELQ